MDLFPAPGHSLLENQSLLNTATTSFSLNSGSFISSHSSSPLQDTFTSTWWRSPSSFEHGHTNDGGAVAIFDPSVADLSTLVAGVAPGTDVYILDPTQNAIAQITNILAQEHNISSLSLFAHGDPGEIDFSSMTFDFDDLGVYSADLQQWSKSLAAGAGISIYSCEVAASDQGKTFLQQWSQLAGVGIAASSHLVGNAAQGGTWALDFTTSDFNPSEILQPWAQAAYQSVLDTFTVSNTNDSGFGSLRLAIAAANDRPGLDTITFDPAVFGSSPQTITLTSGQLIINDSLDLFGPLSSTLTISGNNSNRVFFVNQGTVSLSNLTIANGLATGGDGSSGGGGGGGFGGGLFINDGTVSLNNLVFTGNQAIGGNGAAGSGGGGGGFAGDGGIGGGGGGGGGGFAGNGGNGDGSGVSGGGGGGFAANGTNGTITAGGTGGAGTGSIFAGTPAGDGTGATGGTGGAGGGIGGGGGGGSNGNGGAGSTGGGGGGSGGNNTTGGLGGDFGGGGGGFSVGGSGGFAGGGGGGFTAGGNGGFGGGGGSSVAGGAGNGQGGTLGGAGGSNGGGGGAGLGGAVFIRNGSLNITGGVFNNNAANGGGAGGGGALGGQGKAGAIFTGPAATFTSSNLVFNNNTASNAGSTASDNANAYISPPAITLTPTTLPAGTAGTTFSQALVASGGTSPYNFAVTGGGLPSGLTLSPTGQLSGTTGLAGTFNFTATATDNNNFTGSNPYQITIAPAAPSIVSFFSGAGQSAVVNNAFATPLAARVTDQFNNPISGITVTFAAPTTGASGSFGAGDNTITATTDQNGVATTPFTANTVAGAYSVLASIQGGTSAAAFSLTNVPGNAAALTFTGLPTTTTAGTVNDFTVTAQDTFGNTATNYTGVVLFTSSDGQAVLPTNASLTNGTGSFSATLRTIGSQTISASSGTLSSVSATLTVDPGAASTLQITNLPTNTIAGTPSPLTLTARDAFGNRVTNYNGVVLFTSSDGQAVLPTNVSLTNGTGDFNVTLRTAGTQTLNISSGILTPTSASLTVTPSSAANLAIAGLNPAVAAGAPQALTVTARDAFGNTATTYNGVVLFTSSDGRAVLPPNTALSNGTGAFNVTFGTTGAQSVSVRDTVTASITGTSNTTVGAGNASQFVLTGLPNTTTAGNPNPFTVTAQDAFGNTASNYNGVVLFTSTDGQAILPPNATLNNGTGTFSTILRTAGIQSVRVTDSQNSTITGQQTGITVSPAATNQFQVSGIATPTTAGNPNTFTVTAQDAFGNTTPTYTGTVLFTSTDGRAVLPTNATLSGGTGTFNATLRTAGTQSVTATDSQTSSITGTQSGILVNAGAASTLAIAGLPGTLAAGTSQALTITAQDAFGNTATGYNGVVLFTSSDGQAVLPTNANLSSGTGTFNATLRTAGTQTINVTGSGLTGASATTTVTPGTLAQFGITGVPSTLIAGTSQPLTVTAQDTFGNTVTTYNGVVLFTSNDGQATLPTNARLTNGAGTFNAILRTAGSGRSLTATDSTNSAITGNVTGITVVPGATSVLSLSGFPSTVTAGAQQAVTVTAQDAFGNTATNYNGVLLFTSSDGRATLPPSLTVTGGTGTFNATLFTSGQQSLTATDSLNSALTTTLSPITVNPAVASSFLITGPSTVTAGTAQLFTAAAQDAFGNTATNYTGTVLFTSNDGQAVLPTNVTFNQGTATFSATLRTAGTRSLTITDSTNNNLTGTSSNITVNPADASVLQLSGFPATTTAGLPQAVTVTARDPFGNTATGYRGVVLFTSSDGQAVLPTNATLNNGTGTFSATLRTAGTQTLLANSGSLASNSLSITVNPAAASNFSLSGFPATVTAGTQQSFSVTARDDFGNTATGYTGTVLFTSNDGQATLPTAATLNNGTGTFNATLRTVGTTRTLTATDSNNSTITGTQSGITVTPAAASRFVVAGFTNPTVAGTQSSFSVTAQDAFGNLATTYNGVVLFTSNDGQATLPPNARLTNGTGTFNATLRTAGPRSLTATDSVNSAVTGSQTGILITPAATNRLQLTGLPTSATAGTLNTFTVIAQDAFGNTTPGYAGTVLFTSSDGQAVLPTNTPLTNGTGTFAATLRTAGNQSLSVNSTGLTGATANLTITPAAASLLTLTGPTTTAAGTAQPFNVTARDAFGNTDTNYTGTVLFTSSDGQAVLPTNASLNAGAGTFNATLRTVGTQTVSITSGNLTGASTSLTVTPGAASRLVLTGLPLTTIAGTTQSFTLTAQDASGNVATNYNGVVLFTSSDGQAVLPTNARLTNGTGTFNATLRTAGSQSIIANSGNLSSVTGNVNVTPSTATSFQITGLPATTQAGTAANFVVTARDAFNNTATGYTGTVLFTSSDGQAVLPPNNTLTNGVGNFSATFRTAGTQSLTATDSVIPTITGNRTGVIVTAGATSQFRVTGLPPSTTAGTANPLTITAQDAFGNTTPTYTGSVRFTSTDTQAVLPPSVSFSTGTGIVTTAVVLRTAGLQSVTAIDTQTPAITGTQSGVAVTPAATSGIFLSGLPTTVTAGTANAFTVTARDAFGNTTPGYTGQLRFTSNDAQAVLPANTTLVNGVGNFTATLRTAGTGRTVTATDIGTPALTGSQGSITVNPAAASVLQVGGFPTPSSAGTQQSFTVTARDPFGNTATGYNGTVVFTSSDGQALLPTNSTLTSGTGSFNATLRTAGSQNLIVTDNANSSLTGNQSGIVITPAATSRFLLSGFPATVTAGTPQSFSLTAQDAFGNTTPNYTGVVVFTSNDGQAVLPNSAGLVNGTGTFNATLKTAGARSLTATDLANSTITATQTGITVNPALTSQLVVAGFPRTTTAGVNQNFTVTAQDPFGNITPGYTTPITFASSDNQAVLPTSGALTNGTGSFTTNLRTAGNQTFTVGSGNLPSVISNLTVNAAAASVLIPTVSTTQLLDINRTLFNPLRVRVTDAFGNPVAGNTVTFSTPNTGAGASFQGGLTVTTNGLGIATASPLVANSQLGTYNVTATATGIATPVTFNFTNTNPFIVDINGDNRSDLFWRENSTGANAFWLMDGLAFSVAGFLPPAPTADPNWVIASSGDFNGNGQRDLVWRNNATGDNVIWLMNGTASVASVAIPSVPSGWYIAGTGDFQGDRDVDIVWRNAVTGENAIWFMTGTTLASATLIPPAPTEWALSGVADLNGDGQPDLIWRNYVTGNNAYWTMNGSNFVSAFGLEPVTDTAWVLSTVADYTGDGRADFVWRNYASGDNAIWVMNGDIFVSATAIPSAPLSYVLTNKPPNAPV